MALFILPDYSFYEAMATKRPIQRKPKLLHTFWRTTEHLTQYSKATPKKEKMNKTEPEEKIGKVEREANRENQKAAQPKQ